MSNHAPHNGIADTPEEELVVINVAIGALGTVLASAGILWFKGVAWLLEHKIIVPEAAAPLITIPGTLTCPARRSRPRSSWPCSH